MAKKFIDKDNLKQILESIDEKYLDKNEYESQIRDLKTPTDHSLKFIKNGNIVQEFDGSEDVNLDISSFGGSGDGRDGISKFTSYVFCKTLNGIKPESPIGGEFFNPYPSGPVDKDGYVIWKDVPTGNGTTYISKRIFSSDGNHGEWSVPSLWQDDKEFRIEYSNDYTPGINSLPNFQNFYESYDNIENLEDKASEAEKQWRLYCENNGYGTWGDNVIDPIYMATCSLSNGQWSDWTVSKIKGENGIASFESVIYKRSFNKPEDQLEGGDYNNPYPNNYNELGWSTDIPTGLGRLWRSYRLFISDGSGDKVWSDIQLWQDYPGFQVEYSTDFDMTKTLPNFDNFYQSSDTELVAEQTWRDYCKNNDLGTWGDSTDNAKYMATCSLKDGSWTNWTVTRIKGESSNHLELSNEFDQIYVIDNKPIENQLWLTTISYFEGSTKVDLDLSEVEISVPDGFQSTINGNNLEISLTGEPTITDDIKISIKYNDHEKTLLLKRFEGNIDYDLYASSTFYKCDSAGVVKTDTIGITIHKTEVGRNNKFDIITSIDNLDFKLVYKGISNNIIEDLLTITTGEIIDLTKENYLSNKYDSIRLELYKGEQLLDLINIEKLIDGKDGKDGKDGTSINVKGTVGAESELPIPPENPSDCYILGENLYVWDGSEWVNVGKFTGTDGNTPYIGENGNWWIGDKDTGIKAEGKDGKDGINGISSFLSIVFIRSYNTPTTPSGGSYDSPRPDDNDWSDSIPAGSLPLWSSHRAFSSDGNHGEWSKPVLLADSYHFQVEYGKEDIPASPLANFGEYYKTANCDISTAEANWRTDHPGWSDSTEDAFYMATCSKTGRDTWSDWLVTQIKGEKGDAGQFTEFRYFPSGYYSKAPELNIKEVNPEGWSTTMSSTSAAPYIWMTQSIKSGDGEKLIKDWSYPSLVTIPGKDGSSESGLARIPYYAGVVIDSKTYKTTDHTTPYITTSKGEAYVLIAESAYGNEIQDTSKWALMEQYQSLFAELAIIDNGTLGSAVFYKDFMYSKIGISGNEVITTFAPYDSSGNKKSIDTIITDNNRPSYLVDLKTGEGYYAGGVIKFNKDSAQLGKFIVDSNGFTYAEQGSWGYESNTNNTTATVTSLRSYCPNADTINVNLKSGTVPYGTYPLEGRINAKKGTTVKFDNVAAQSFVVDDNNVLTYLTEPNGTSDYTVKVINNIKYVNATGVEMNIYNIYMEFYSGEEKQKPEPDYVRVEVKDSLNNTVYYGPVESCTVTNNGKTYDYTISLVIPSEVVKMKIAVFNSDSLDGGKYSDYISITRPNDSFYTIEVQDE